VKIALADRQPQLTGVGWVSGPEGNGPRPATKLRDPILTVMVKDAVRRLDREDGPTILDAAQDPPGEVDAVLWVHGAVPEDEMLSRWPGAPAAAVFQGDLVPTIADVDVLDLSHTNRRSATNIIFRWLSSSSAFVSMEERQMLDALLSEVHTLLDAPASRVPATRPLLDALQAIEVQLTAPRTSRRAVGAALEQIADRTKGAEPSLGIVSIPELLMLFGRGVMRTAPQLR
jgi:hypothetical protein